jgi:hypothetical protein
MGCTFKKQVKSTKEGPVHGCKKKTYYTYEGVIGNGFFQRVVVVVSMAAGG